MSTVTFDGANIAEVADFAGDRFEGSALLIRHADGHLTLVQPGFVLERDGDDLEIWSSQGWRRRKTAEAA